MQKSGSWYTSGNEKLGQGRENVVVYLEEHPELLQSLEAEIRSRFKLPVQKAVPAGAAGDNGAVAVQAQAGPPAG